MKLRGDLKVKGKLIFNLNLNANSNLSCIVEILFIYLCKFLASSFMTGLGMYFTITLGPDTNLPRKRQVDKDLDKQSKKDRHMPRNKLRKVQGDNSMI